MGEVQALRLLRNMRAFDVFMHRWQYFHPILFRTGGNIYEDLRPVRWIIFHLDHGLLVYEFFNFRFVCALAAADKYAHFRYVFLQHDLPSLSAHYLLLYAQA